MWFWLLLLCRMFPLKFDVCLFVVCISNKENINNWKYYEVGAILRLGSTLGQFFNADFFKNWNVHHKVEKTIVFLVEPSNQFFFFSIRQSWGQ